MLAKYPSRFEARVVALAQADRHAAQGRKARGRLKARMETANRERKSRMALPARAQRQVTSEIVGAEFGVVNRRVQAKFTLGKVEESLESRHGCESVVCPRRATPPWPVLE